MAPIAPPRGTKDLLPADAPAWEWLHRTHAAAASSYGYQRIDTPVFEATELFARGVGDGTDVVDKEMYSFVDRGGRSLTLRPEGTAPVLRAVVGDGLLQRQRPVRVHYAMAMFRYDRPQAGRQRQFAQVGAELLGDHDASYDAEVIELAWDFMGRLGITGVEVQINTLGDRADRLRYREALVAYYEPLRAQLCEDCQRRLDINPLRVLDCKRDVEHVARAPLIAEHLSDESRQHFSDVLSRLDGAGVPYTRNPRLVRGLDYYAHTAFEFWHSSLSGAQNAVGGGGRYDGLAEVLELPPTPGVGYALGVERLLRIAADLGVTPSASAAAPVVLLTTGNASGVELNGVIRRLREHIAVSTDVTPRRLDKKLRDAARSGASVALLVGLDEGLVVRNLRTREQRVVDVETVADAVLRELATDAVALS